MEFNRLEFWTFLLLGRLLYPSQRAQSALAEERIVDSHFLNGISARWNANHLLQGLNSGC